MEFEDILKQVGGYGKYQKLLTLIFVIPSQLVFPWINFDVMFMVSVPDHWCYVEDVAKSNLSVLQQRTLVSPKIDSSCFMYDVNYTEYLNENIGILNSTNKVPCQTGWEYDKTDYTSTASTKWDLVCDRRYFPSLIQTLEIVGCLILTPVYGLLADEYGRKRVYLLLMALASLTDLVSVLVNDLYTFMVLRTIHGSVLPSVVNLSFMLITEIVNPEVRAHINGISNTCWTAGMCILPLIVYLSRNWINLGLICSITCGSFLLYSRYVPESPCWLISKEKYEEATSIIEKIGIINQKPQERTQLFKQLQDLGQRIQEKKATSKKSSYLFLRYPTLRKRFLISTVCWMAFSITYYGLTYNVKNVSGNEFLNFFLLSIVEMPSNIVFWALIDRAGRRWTASIGFISLGLACLGPLTGAQYGNIVFSMIGKFIANGIYMITLQQATELFPTETRSFAMSLSMTLSTIVGLTTPFLADSGSIDKNLPFIVMAGISLAAGTLAAFLPETLNENLPQTILDAENFGKNQAFFSWRRRKSSTEPKIESWKKKELEIERF